MSSAAGGFEGVEDVVQVLALAHAGFLEEPPRIPDERHLSALFPLFWHLGRINESLRCIDLLERRGALELDALLMRGYWQLYRGEVPEAQRSFEAALVEDPAQNGARLGHAYALFYAQDYSGAAREFQGLVADRAPFKSAVVMAAASRKLATGRRPDMIQAAPIPGLPPGMSEVLQTRLLEGDAAAAAAARKWLRDLSADDGLPMQRLLLELLIDLERDDEALALAEDLHPELPSDGMISYMHAIVLRRKGARDESHAMFEEATLFAPFEARAWAAVGAGCIERNDPAEAARSLRISLFIDESSAGVWGELGQAETLLEHYDAGQDAFTRAIHLGAETFFNYLNRGSCFNALGNTTRGLADWAKAMQIDPNHPRVPEIRQRMGELGIPSGNDYAFGDLNDQER